MTSEAVAAAVAIELPPFADPEESFRRVSSVMMPRKRLAVADAAELYRFVNSGGQSGMWRNTTAPYLTEPMNLTASRDFEAVIFAGPARCGKTDGLVINPLVHRVICDPCSMLVVTTSQSSARLFSLDRVDPMNRICPEMRRRLSGNRNDDNKYDKLYAGMRLVLGWPTLDHLTGKDYQFVAVTEYDRMAESIGGEGSVFEQARKRNTTYGSRGMTVIECSPARDVTIDPEKPWTPHGHEAPPCTGILDLFNQGDRRLWTWQCPHCGEHFEGRFSLLDWPKDKNGRPIGSIEEAADAVEMICPNNGCRIEPRYKEAMNAGGRWLREGETMDAAGAVVGEPRRSRIASFWLKGTAAAFQTWGGLVRSYLRAEEAFLRNGDVEALRGVTNIDLGEPYWPRPEPGTEVLDKDLIAGRREQSWKLGTVPAGVRALVVTVDVQGRYFDVQVTGFGPDWECWIVDRMQIAQSADPDRLCDPGSHPEDWALIEPLLDRGWPLADDPSQEMTALCMVVDSGGAPGVTGNAYKFAYALRKRGISPARFMLLKGDAKVGPKRIYINKLDFTAKGQMIARGQQLLMIASNDLKDDIAGALRRNDPGAGYVHTPGDLNDEWYAQVTAEHKTDKGWEVRPGQIRNEAFDHMVYARAAVMRPPWRWDRLEWARPPTWATPLPGNPRVRGIDGASGVRAGTVSAPPSAAAAAGTPLPPVPNNGAWLGERQKGWLKPR